MKRTVPLLITACVGFVLLCSAFVPAAESWGEKALIWFDLLAAIAFILGGANLVGSQLKKISARRKGWGYSAVTLISFLVTLTVGLLKVGVAPAPRQEFYGESFAALPVEALPVTTFAVNIPDEVRRAPLPPSVRRQVRLEEGDIAVSGWLSTGQIADLSDVHPTLDWQCSIQKLADDVMAPAALRGRLAYRPDHQALSFRGVISDAEKSELKALAPGSAAFQRAIDELSEKSNRRYSVAGAAPPAGFDFPSGLAAKASIGDGMIQWTGPMSAEERAELAVGSLRSRIAYPLNAQQQSAFESQIADGGGRLNDDQRKAFTRIASRNFADDLISAVNSAGAAAPGTKSACDLVAERNSGVTELDPVIPAAKSIELVEAQKEAIRSFVTADAHDWSALEGDLRSKGPFNAAMARALTAFRSKLPTLGQRDRQLFDELIAAGPLTGQQRERLLKEFRVEQAWQAAVSRAFFASHEVKSPWSGDFLQPGSRFWWLFEYAYQPVQSMMFALLAFYVASAAFRAFRAKNIEATLLLGTAFIILLGRTYVGALTTAWLPKDNMFRLENLSVDIMRVFNSAGNRAIMIGIALGIASTSLKILLGIDRSHTGGKD